MRSAGEMDQADAELRATICKVKYLIIFHLLGWDWKHFQKKVTGGLFLHVLLDLKVHGGTTFQKVTNGVLFDQFSDGNWLFLAKRINSNFEKCFVGLALRRKG